MKRITALLITAAMIISLLTTAVFAEQTSAQSTASLKIGQEYQKYDKELILVTVERANYQVLAPARPFIEALGATLEWDETAQSVTCKKGDKYAVLTIGAETAEDNGEEYTLETPAQLVDDTAYLPAEFVGKALGFRVLRQMYGRDVRIMSYTSTETPFDEEIKPGMAELKSTYHRPVPTEFEKSNELDDLYWFTDTEYKTPDELETKSFDFSTLPKGDVIYTNDDLMDCIEPGSQAEGEWKIVDIDDEAVDSKRALQIRCWYTPTNTTFFIVKPPKRTEEYVDMDDKYLVKLKVRKTAGGNVDTGMGKLYMHIEEDYRNSWEKSLSETMDFGDQWQEFKFIATGVENANHLGFTTGFYLQTIQITDLEIQKLDKNTDISAYLESRKTVDYLSPELSKDAPWRAEALDRIEKIRKGDFKVVVKDKDGNPVPNAEVKFDMFEHEFQWGCVMDSTFINPELAGHMDKNMRELSVNFNTTGCGNALKVSDFNTSPNRARRKFDDAKAIGIKNFRGHAIWMPLISPGNGVWPYYYYGEGQQNMDWDTFEKYTKTLIHRLVKLYPEINEWDVSNEMVNRVTWDSVYGRDYIYKIYEWCAEVFPESMKIGLCDNQLLNEQYWMMLDRYQRDGIRVDHLVDQGHTSEPACSATGIGRRPTKLLEYYDRYVYEYGKPYSVSEFSCRANDENYQADLTRDTIIANFSHPGCRAFSFFWLSDMYSEAGWQVKAGCQPLFNRQFEPRVGLKQYQDLVYNKWWTRDAKTTTDTDGRGQIRGFYGDYDISVSIDGKEVKTTMAAFHKGYENELTITLD